MNTTVKEDLSPEYVRLHITPLNPTILPSIVPKSVLLIAKNISFHSIQTFPEKSYGFVDLPVMEAEKIKKKLNGTILKGTKVRIEEARPEKTPKIDEDVKTPVKTKTDKSKKRRRDAETIPAIELQDRKVKRGWTDPEAPARSEKKSSKKKKKDKKEAVRSKYTSEPECLFRTKLPDNVTSEQNSKRHGDRKKGKGKEAIIHEFSKTVKYASFLRDNTISSPSKEAAEYVDGKGWVNRDGEVIEAFVEKKVIISSKTQEEEPTDLEKSSELEESSDDDSLAEKEAALKMTPTKIAKKAEAEDYSTLSSESTSPNDFWDIGSNSTPEETSRPVSVSGASLGLTISIPKSGEEAKTNVHPLEALYKRRRPGIDAPGVTGTPPSFSFFGADDDEEEEEQQSIQIPMTPFTQQDFQHRGLRSAAPTPDTAHPSRASFIRPWLTDNNYEADDDSGFQSTPSDKRKNSAIDVVEPATEPMTDFNKWFYENRGQQTRNWKKASREAAKEKRHSENKKRRGLI